MMRRQLMVSPETLAVEQAIGESMMEVTPAARGAALLDERYPGWVDRIDLRTFDIRDGAVCVLGQVFAESAVEHGSIDGFTWALGNRGPLVGLDDDEYGFAEGGDYQRVCDARPDVATAARAYPFPAHDLDAFMARHEDEEGWALLQADWVMIIRARQERRGAEHDLAVSGD